MNPPHFSNYMRLQTLFLFRSLCQNGRASLSGISDPLKSYRIYDLVKYGWQAMSLTLDELQKPLVEFSATRYLFVRV
jgi:hypothetical protein